MRDFNVKVGKELVPINGDVFLTLFSQSHLKELKGYKDAVRDGVIAFSELKDLASKADVPYPLFFAPIEIVKKQKDDMNQNLFGKIPSRDEMLLNSRGKLQVEDMELIIKDLGRKQEFFKKRIMDSADDNDFVGLLSKEFKTGTSNIDIANSIRSYLEIDLNHLRSKSKEGVLGYIRQKAEEKNILTSLSSHNFMPQNIDPDLGVSGICIRDKKFPTIFVNTRDGDEDTKMFEPVGRQIFTLLSMLVCVAIGKFVFSTKGKKPKKDDSKRVFAIVGEIMIPEKDITNKIGDIDELKKQSKEFKVTPSMMLMRHHELKLINKTEMKKYLQILKDEVRDAKPSKFGKIALETGYAKYNGVKFSREVVGALRLGKISELEAKNVLFRKGRMSPDLLQKYINKFKLR